MASDPKHLQSVLVSLLNGSDMESVPKSVRDFLWDYMNGNKGNLLKALPKWRGLASTTFDTDEEIEAVKSTRFDIFDSKNIKHIKKFSIDLEKKVDDGKPLTKDEAIEFTIELAKGLGMTNDEAVPMFQSLAKTCYVSVNNKLEEQQVKKEKVEPGEKQVKKEKEKEKVEEKPKEPWEIELAEQKKVALRLCDEADNALILVKQYTGTIPDEDKSGAQEVIDRLSDVGDKAVTLRNDLIDQGKGNKADGINNILRMSVLPGIDDAKLAQRTLLDRYEELKQTKSEVDDLKKEIHAINTSAGAGDMAGKLSALENRVEILKAGEVDAKGFLEATVLDAKARIVPLEGDGAKIKGNNAYTYRYSNRYERNKAYEDLEGGGGGILTGIAGSGEDGQPNLLVKGARAVFRTVASIGDSWHDAKMGARSQKSRLAYNIAEHVAIGFGGLIALNSINSLFFDNKMNRLFKWGIMGIMGLYLINRSGKVGREMTNHAKARTARAQSSSGLSHRPRGVPTNRQYTGDNAAKGETPPTASNANLPVITDKEGNIVRDIVVYYPEGVIVQDQKGGMPQDKGKVVNMENWKVGKGLNLNIPENVKKEIIARVDGHVHDKLIPNEIADRDALLAGPGVNLPKDLCVVENDIEGKIRIQKINGIDLGENAINVTYYANKGIVEKALEKEFSGVDAKASGQ
ncbi:MAG: hypothetical protein KAJ29_01660 [Alphaproteobacteria bacterium]|nr:hypothetical protein [Alphaproteobacteria bacterium]